jgi:hypothetical protein
MKNWNYIKKGDKSGQFYLVATIVIVGLVIGLALILNYSNKSSSYEAEEIAKELSIESEKVMDYDTFNSADEFENFANAYSSYAGEEKEIYFIKVNGTNVSDREAYRYIGETKNNFNNNLTVDVDNKKISLYLYDNYYSFNLEEGKNFYFVLIYDNKGERYVYTG